MKCKTYTVFFCLLMSLQAFSQEQASTSQKKGRWVAYVYAGPNYYFNNVVVGKDMVNEFNYTGTVKLMWEPEYRVSLGVETGYYRLYTATGTGQAKVHIVNSATPVHFVAAMNLLKSYYFDLSIGPSFLSNKVHSDSYGDFDGSSVSLSDFSGTLSYRFNWKGRFRLGFGPKFFYSSHLNDRSLALVFMAGYKL
ncbi:MAG: hypothetical protein ACXVBX_08875 [Flavisolibacter sp.]